MDGFCDINGVEAKGWAMASKPAVVSSKNVQQEARKLRSNDVVMASRARLAPHRLARGA